MRYRSTRGGGLATFSEAVLEGLAPNGGLYVPESLPKTDPDAYPDPTSLPDVGTRLLAPFVAGDALAGALGEVCTEALSFPTPLVPLHDGAAVLELDHGPTAAFKDVGARFFAQCLARCAGGERTVLVATSGDTGGAVAAALAGQSGIRVGILFPNDGVSERQRKQLTCWGGNVRSLAVRGTFDDCQRVLKRALADDDWRRERQLTTANSINVARLLPQVVYYAAAAMQWQRAHGEAPGFIVPSGNAGNATAALWARALGFPIREVMMATNANRTVPDYLATGELVPRPSVRTLANAMDVGAPSNMERVLDRFPSVDDLRGVVRAVSVDDEAIRETIRRGPARHGRIWDPHTATAARALDQAGPGPWILVATAHPAKFPEVVEPLIGRPVDVPPALDELLSRPSYCEEIEPDLDALRDAMA